MPAHARMAGNTHWLFLTLTRLVARHGSQTRNDGVKGQTPAPITHPDRDHMWRAFYGTSSTQRACKYYFTMRLRTMYLLTPFDVRSAI